MRTLFRIAVPMLALLTLSCASTSELVHRGDVALAAGDSPKAFDWARRALDHEPSNPRARALMGAAAGSMLAQSKNRIRNLAEVDTVGAARAALDLDQFRAQLAHYRVEIAADPAFAGEEQRIKTGAAGIYYDLGRRSLKARRPKAAFAQFTQAEEFAPGYRDVGEQVQRAHEAAITRIAILPFNDEVSIPELSASLAGDTWSALAYQLTSKHFQFTRLIGKDQVDQRLTVAQLGHLSREEAVRLGRAVGARRVVIGRFHGLRSNTNSDTYHETIYHKVSERDESGATRERFAEERFEAVSRQRQVTIVFDFDVIETDEGGRLAQGGEERHAVAHTVFTRFSPVGSCGDYCLAPPDAKDSDRAKRIEKDWHSTFGSWSLPALLEHARKDPGRTRYLHEYRSDFASAGTSTPVFLDDLPPVEEMAMIALSDVWVPVLAALRDLDGKDDVEIVAGHDGD